MKKVARIISRSAVKTKRGAVPSGAARPQTQTRSARQLLQANARLRKETERAVQRANERLEMAQRASGAGIWDWDIAAKSAMDTIGVVSIGMALIRMSGSIVSVNPAFERMTGYKHAEIAGNDAQAAIGKMVAAIDRPRILDRLKAARQGKPADSLATILTAKTGVQVFVMIDLAFIKDLQGRPSGIVMTFKDITELRRTEEGFHKIQARLVEAQRIAHIGNWEWNIPTNALVWSDEVYRIFGRQPQEFDATYGTFLQAVHPEDRGPVREAVDKALHHAQTYNIVHRIVLPDRTERMVHEHGEVFRDEAGQPVRMAGTIQDVTEHAKVERRDQIITTLLALFARKSSRNEYLDAVIKVLHQTIGCRCIGIRVADGNGHIPYEASIGFPAQFLRKESSLVIGRDFCICARVIAGKSELQNLACRSAGGSFLCDDMIKFMNSLAPGEKELFRGECIKRGYASLVVVPIRYHDQIYGAIHLADERAGKVTREQTDFIESIMAPMIGEAIQWFTMDQSLRQAGAYNRSLIDASLDPLVTIDAGGKITDVNLATEKVTGYARDELIGTDFADYFTDFEKAQSGYQQVFLNGWVQDYALEIRHRDGHLTPVLYNASVYRNEDGAIAGVFAAARNISERLRAQQAVEVYQNELRALSSRISLAEEVARRQLAVALHDTVGQTLALSKIKLGALGELLTDRASKAALAEIRNMFENAVSQTRTLCFELSPPILYELGLDAAIEWLGEEFQQRHGFQFHFESMGDKTAIQEPLNVMMFQSVRELLVNVGKHAAATHVTLSSQRVGGQITIIVSDNGKGFDCTGGPEPVAKNKSLGLFSIRERMRHMGGAFHIESKPGHGTTATLSVPMDPQAKPDAADIKSGMAGHVSKHHRKPKH